MGFVLGWIIFSFIVGAIGDSRKIGFGVAFLTSLFLSPLIGLIVTLVSKNKKEEEYQNEILRAHKAQQEALDKMVYSKPVVKETTSIVEELEKLKNLKAEGIITDEEFKSLKKKVIDSNLSITRDLEENAGKEYAFKEKLANGKILQYLNEIDSKSHPEVRINDTVPNNGYYKPYDKFCAYKIKDGKIIKTLRTKSYKQKNGDIIEIGNLFEGFLSIKAGNPVWLNEYPAPDGIYEAGFLLMINVVNGKVV